MIVTEQMVEQALAYLNEQPHPLARARKRLLDAENKAKQLYAKALLLADGPVDARKATAETAAAYVKARDDEANATLELEDHRQRVRGAEFIIECWRTENANIRAAERVR
jgi:hypothetical protein